MACFFYRSLITKIQGGSPVAACCVGLLYSPVRLFLKGSNWSPPAGYATSLLTNYLGTAPLVALLNLCRAQKHSPHWNDDIHPNEAKFPASKTTFFSISALLSGEEPCQFFQELVWPNRTHTMAPAPLVASNACFKCKRRSSSVAQNACFKCKRRSSSVAQNACFKCKRRSSSIASNACFKCKRRSSSVASNACFKCKRRSSSVAHGWVVIFPPPHPKPPRMSLKITKKQKKTRGHWQRCWQLPTDMVFFTYKSVGHVGSIVIFKREIPKRHLSEQICHQNPSMLGVSKNYN